MIPEINWIAVLVAGLIPMILGAIYYGPLLGKQWLSSMGKTEEEMVPGNMAVTYGLALLMAMLLSASIKFTNELVHKDVVNGEMVWGSFHTFQHGAFHGAMLCITLIVPVIVSLSLFHKSSGKNIILNVIFWIACCALMGGILDAWN